MKKIRYGLYRAVDSDGQTLDVMLKKCFRQTLGACHTVTSRVLTVDQTAAYPPAVKEFKEGDALPQGCERRQRKYLKNRVEQDHRGIKRRVNPGLGFGSFATAERTIPGSEVRHMIRNGPFNGAARGDVLSQNAVIAGLFGVDI